MGSIQPGTAIVVICLVVIVALILFSSDTGASGCLGTGPVIGGIVGAVYFYFIFDASVTTTGMTVAGQTYGGGIQVSNIGLLADRQNGLLLSIGAAVVGTILLVAANRQPQVRQQSQAAGVCPACGVNCAAAAAYCPGCGSQIGTVSPLSKLTKLAGLKKQEMLTDEEFRVARARALQEPGLNALMNLCATGIARLDALREQGSLDSDSCDTQLEQLLLNTEKAHKTHLR